MAGRNRRAELDETVERSLKGAALWDEVKDKLHESAYGLSGGQHRGSCNPSAFANAPKNKKWDAPGTAMAQKATKK